MKTFLLSVIFVFFGAISNNGWALENEFVDAINYSTQLAQKLKQLEQMDPYLISQLKQKGKKPILNVSPLQKKRRAHYRKLEKQLEFWEPAAGLQKALLTTYQKYDPKQERDQNKDLRAEASRLSVELIRRIQYLQKKEYKIHSFPVVHNFLIMLHYKKRGACKHWAEDLLKTIETIPRRYFTAYWGESHAGQVFEHNVAVLVPRGASFDAGLMIDPWRTAGKPFWLNVTQDHFYHWTSWSGYEPR